MKEFMGADFLLESELARELYHGYAEGMPIIDYHCHVDAREIFLDRRFSNIAEVWLEADHYKWRLMRSNGVEERFITGDACGREKFQKFAEALPRAIGNPMYHWCHLELKAYFGYDGILNGDTAEEVWQLAEKKLAEPEMSVRGIIRQSNVAFIGTTDDPTSTLEWHKKLAADADFHTVVAPSFRPDKALDIEKPGWIPFLKELEAVSNTRVTSLDGLEAALSARMDAFAEAGCRASDHGLSYVPYRVGTRAEVDAILKKGLGGEKISTDECDIFKTAMLIFCAGQYVKRGWVMQIHYNCVRNPNSAMLRKLGADSGFDSISGETSSGALYSLLDELCARDSLPKTVLYSLNPAENEVLDSMIGAFQDSDACGKLQHGAAWWFNDSKSGMLAQMTSLANMSILGNFIGMLTDSRAFLSYTRHAYFRRILSQMIASLVENGEYPNNIETLGTLVRDISCNNAKRYFGLEN